MLEINANDPNYKIVFDTVNCEFYKDRVSAFRACERFANLMIETYHAFELEGFEYDLTNSGYDDHCFTAIVHYPNGCAYAVVERIDFYNAYQAFVNRNSSDDEVVQILPYRDIQEAVENDPTVAEWYYKPATLTTSGLHYQTCIAWDNVCNQAYEFTLHRDYKNLTKYLSKCYYKYSSLSDLIPELWNALSTVLYYCGVDTTGVTLNDE